jgi:acetyl-CoA carboxylase alpha subunit
MTEETKIVSLTEVIKQKENKERELSSYRRHLEMIEDRMAFLEMDRKVTLEIIEMIENDSVVMVGDDDYNLDE